MAALVAVPWEMAVDMWRIRMRAAFQILAIPYRLIEGTPLYCVFHRADCGQWQFIAGGGEDDETLLEAAKREAFEEAGVRPDKWIELRSLSFIPAAAICETARRHWGEGICTIPEYAFAFECREDIRLSYEHSEYVWLHYDAAVKKLTWDSNRAALYELDLRWRQA